ncbi:hypothetical protein NST07_06470 [Paenibacillus sp. FSL L8-0340]|uniref:hypothetical protein n=1 Tax=Paenibacillus sp. FSL L8-0340 TaxID=2954685 RepID=UPI00315802FD
MRSRKGTACSPRKAFNSWRKKGTEGSVSIFLIMILAFVFLFTAVLIDYARIAAVNVQQERLARAAVRSVMSSYDIQLRESYGLFAFGGSDGNQLLSGVLNDNLYESGRGDAFNLLPLGLDSSVLNWSRPLGSYDVFQRQIAEEMKYKAPVDFALELAGKFKPLSAAMGEASRSTQLFGKLQPLYDEREAALDLMMERRKQAAESVRSLQELIMNPPGDHIEYRFLGEITSAADIAAMYDDYVGKYYADFYREEDEYSRYSSQISEYLRETTEFLPRIPSALTLFRTEHTRLIADAGNALQRVRELNEEMRYILEQSRANGAGSAEDSARNWDIPGSAGELSTEPLKKMREQEDSLILAPAEVSAMEHDLNVQETASQTAEQAASGLPGALSGATGLDADFGSMNTAVLNALQAVSSYHQNYGEHGDIIAAEARRIEAHRTSDRERKQIERQAKAKLNDAMKLLDQIRQLGDSAGAARERYQMLSQYYQDNIQLNSGSDQEASNAQNTSDPYAAGSSSMAKTDDIYAAMGSIMEGARDRLFRTEYSAMYFPHFDLSKLTPVASGSAGAAALPLADQLDPHAQELEYILYGFHNPAGNVAAAYGEIFALRLAIRTMEGFIESSRLGNPLAILAAALLYGIEQAVQDMLLLCRAGEIPLSKYMPAKLSYRDYLRLFMLLHGGGDVQLSRMLALIRLNTGINPAEKFTYASAEIKMAMPLWFLPGVVKLVDYSAGLPGDVQGRLYYRGVKADFSY